MLFNKNFSKAIVYAGLLSNALGLIVCLLFKEWELCLDKSIDLSIWVAGYIIHRKVLGTW